LPANHTASRLDPGAPGSSGFSTTVNRPLRRPSFGPWP